MDSTALGLAKAYDSLIGKTGLIRVVNQILRAPEEPRLFNASCVHAFTSVFMGADIEGHTGAAAFTLDEAKIGAIGECIERYCCAYCDWDNLIFASKRELGDSAVGMDAFAVFAPEQYEWQGFPFPRWTEDLRIRWVKGQSLVTGQTKLIPACLVYVPYLTKERARPSDFLTFAVSSGQACHLEPRRALLSGICEVIERDAFMITWLNRREVPRVDYLADERVRTIHEKHFAGCGIEFHVFDMTTDMAIPSMFCVAVTRSRRGPMIGVGASTRPCAQDAVIKALVEAAQDLAWARDLLRRKPDWRPTPGYGNVFSFEDHVRLFCEPDMIRHLDFLLQTPKTTRLPPEPSQAVGTEEELQRCISAVTARGHDVVLVDTTAPEIADAGFYAPKVFVPGTVPLTSVHTLPALGSPRLRSVATPPGGFNSIPHPFP